MDSGECEEVEELGRETRMWRDHPPTFPLLGLLFAAFSQIIKLWGEVVEYSGSTTTRQQQRLPRFFRYIVICFPFDTSPIIILCVAELSRQFSLKSQSFLNKLLAEIC